VYLTRLSSKGQMVVPKQIRESLGLAPGAELVIEPGRDCFVVKAKASASFPRTTVEEVFGILKHNGPPVTLEDMERGIEEAVRERWARKSR
jgi:AbrB family looped-hinge helix DNA binding protein